MNWLLKGFSDYFAPIITIASFTLGIIVTNIWDGYQESKTLKETAKLEVRQTKIDRGVVADLQDVLIKKELEYQLLKEKLNGIKITSSPCKLTPDAIRLWNKSSGVQGLPSDTKGVTETPTSSDRVENTPIPGVEIKLALENKIENDKQSSEMREQLNKIIQWDKDTFGE